MDFKYKYKISPEDLWFVSMYNIYKSMAGLVNIIFMISIVLLSIRFWSEVILPLKFLITAGILLFPVFQPLFIFLRSRKLVSGMPENMEMIINGNGLIITSGENQSRMDFSDLQNIYKIRGMIILYTKSNQAYILNKRTLAGTGKTLFDFLTKAMAK